MNLIIVNIKCGFIKTNGTSSDIQMPLLKEVILCCSPLSDMKICLSGVSNVSFIHPAWPAEPEALYALHSAALQSS